MNKYVFECDIPILIGHVQGNPYGGYSGGYKHSATGITNWRCIASHHVPSVMHRDDFTPVNGGSLMRNKFDEISMHMEEKWDILSSAVMQYWIHSPDRSQSILVMPRK